MRKSRKEDAVNNKMIKKSFMTSNTKTANICVDLFGKMKVEKGLSLFSGNFEKAFSVAKELKYDGLEISLADPGDLDQPNLKKLSEKYQIGIAAIATGGAAVRDGLLFSSPDQIIREAAVNRIKKFIEFASLYNATVVIGLVKGWVIDSYEQSIKFITECLQECNDFAVMNDVFIALEPINRFQEDFFHSILDCKTYLDEIRLPNIKMMIDSFHMNIEDADMWESIRRAHDYIIHVHYADNNRLAPGMGHFDFMKMTEVLKEIHYNGYISAEILPLPNDYSAAKKTSDSMEIYLY
jgi:5-keto-L-gluconate epimerase